ncbi:MAG: hypothetical protein ABS87_05435 [Sphingomonas sp. SCN 67-18]|uniref:DUF1134 domain-containing protein n=1 Tax=uncultured Sphingomonas sp. TaxID=158754 RepID=UPI00086C2023|nr:DUF1134 domain-containing protein [Sphingomonas sp. SCN 67-18]ODU21793.1 MAG: hypothetical protein ABS87_05435 [Sphingomonas sp. SCN 67-18]
MSTIVLRSAFAALVALAMGAAPALAQVKTVDPNSAIDADLSSPPASQPDTYYDTAPPADQNAPAPSQVPPADSGAAASSGTQSLDPKTATQGAATFKRDDLIGEAEGVFGKGAEGLAGIIEKILKDQGEPNAYIAGREAGGALVVGLRYGSGTLVHAVEGRRPIYWTGPSVGFDVGGNAAKTFVLVYNLYDTQDIYKRFPAGEGNAYFVGGFTASYMRWGNVVIIPIRLGVGYRLGANVGYMKFSEKQNWLPF